MAEFEFKAGAKFHTLTKPELDESIGKLLQDWRVQAGRGPTPRFFSANAKVMGGAVQIGGTDQSQQTGNLGPLPSMAWSVKRFIIAGLDPNVDQLALFRNNQNDSTLIESAVVGGRQRFGSDELVLKATDTLCFVGDALLAADGTVVTVTGQAWEVPETMLYSLM